MTQESTLKPFAAGDIFAGATLLNNPEDDHAGPGRIIQYDSDLNEKGVLWTEGTSHLVGGLVFGPDGNLWAFDSNAHCVVRVSPEGQQLPEINDAFVAETLQFGEGKTLEDLKELISEQIAQQKQRQAEESKVNQVVENLLAKVDFDLPEELVAAEAQGSADDMVSRGAQAGLSDEEIAAQQAEIIATAQVQARNNLKTNFILQEIARAESITASDAEVVQRIAAMAQQQNKSAKALTRELQRSGRISSLKNSILIGKAIDFLVDNAKVEQAQPEAEDKGEA